MPAPVHAVLAAAGVDQLPAGIQRKCMGDMTVTGFGLVIVLLPFLQLTARTDLQGRQLFVCGHSFRLLRCIDAENLLGLDVHFKQTADDFNIHRRGQAQICRLAV